MELAKWTCGGRLFNTPTGIELASEKLFPRLTSGADAVSLSQSEGATQAPLHCACHLRSYSVNGVPRAEQYVSSGLLTRMCQRENPVPGKHMSRHLLFVLAQHCFSFLLSENPDFSWGPSFPLLLVYMDQRILNHSLILGILYPTGFSD